MDKNSKIQAIMELRDPSLKMNRILADRSIAEAVTKLASIKGDQGEKGEKGDKGDKGDSIKGDKGDRGETGLSGSNGKDGKNGRNGIDGKNGLDGKSGINGKDGKDADELSITTSIIGNLKNQKIQDIADTSDLIAFLKRGGFRGGGGSGTGTSGVTSFNTRTGDITLTSLDVTNALGYTPEASLWQRTGTTLSPVNAGDNINTSGSISLGTATLGNNGIISNHLYTNAATSASEGMFTAQIINTSAPTAVIANALVGNLTMPGSNTQNWTNSVGLTAGQFSALMAIGVTGTITSIGANRFSYTNNSTTNTVTNGFELKMQTPVLNNTTNFAYLIAGTNGQTAGNYLIDAINVTYQSVLGGSLGLGVAPATKLHVLSTTEQIRSAYDASNYASFTTSSTGALTLTTTGTNPDITFTAGGAGRNVFNSNVAPFAPGNIFNNNVANVNSITAGFFAPNLIQGTATQGSDLLFGVAASNGNSGLITFSYSGGAGSAANTMGFGIFGSSNTMYISNSKVSIGTPTASALLHVFGTTEQLRLAYDAGNYMSTTIASTGSVTIGLTGTNSGYTFNTIGTGDFNFNAVANTTSPNILNILAANATAGAGSGPYANFGVANSGGNTATIQFIYVAAASASNNISLGIAGTTAPLNIFKGSIGIGINNAIPGALLRLGAGTATASTAPLKFTSGTNLTTTEAGAVEYDGTHLYFTAANSGPRFQLDRQLKNPSVVAMADATSFTPTGDTADINTQTNTQALGTLTANAPSGTPSDGQQLIIRIKSTNVQTFAWNAIYAGCTTTALATSTTGTGKTDKFFFQYNSTSSKWEVYNNELGYA